MSECIRELVCCPPQIFPDVDYFPDDEQQESPPPSAPEELPQDPT